MSQIKSVLNFFQRFDIFNILFDIFERHYVLCLIFKN